MKITKATAKTLAIVGGVTTILSIWVYPIFERMTNSPSQQVALSLTAFFIGAFGLGILIESLMTLDLFD